jgi:hypothetical protein
MGFNWVFKGLKMEKKATDDETKNGHHIYQYQGS